MKKKTPTLRIGIDIDNVISDTATAYLDRFNKFFKTSIKYEEMNYFDFTAIDGPISKPQRLAFIDSVVHTHEFQSALPPFMDAVEVISVWTQKGVGIHYITARPMSIGDVTEAWLARHGFMVKGATLDLFDDTRFSDGPAYKAAAVREKDIDLMIEDTKEIAAAIEAPVLLLDRPWNAGKLPPHVTRVKSWRDIEESVRSRFTL